MSKIVGNAVRKVTGKVRWLGLSVLWSGLLLSGLFLFAFGATTSQMAAARSEVAKGVPASVDLDGVMETAAAFTATSTIAFSSATYTIREGEGDQLVVLLIDPVSSMPVSVTVFSTAIQAEAGEDFEGLRQSLVISPSEPTYTLPVTIFDDALVEGDEQLRLSLSLSFTEGASLGVITETVVMIEDNDVAYVGISDVVVDEEAESVSLVITQSTTSTLESLVDVRTLNGSATAPEDYTALFTSVVITPGSTQTTVTVQLNGDKQVEPAENFFVQLEDPTNAELANITATVTVINDDTLPELAVETAEAEETDGFLPFTVSLNSTWAQTVTVEYATLAGSAIAPQDYLTRTGVVTIAPNTLTATLSVTLVEDETDEPDESFYLILTNPVQAVLSSNEVEGIIHDSSTTSNRVLFLPGIAR